MALSQTKEGRLQVCVLWDKQYETHIVLQNLKFCVNWANIERHAVQTCMHFLVNFGGFEWLYLIQFRPNQHQTQGTCNSWFPLSDSVGLLLLIP